MSLILNNKWGRGLDCLFLTKKTNKPNGGADLSVCLDGGPHAFCGSSPTPAIQKNKQTNNPNGLWDPVWFVCFFLVRNKHPRPRRNK